jgi:hypothetical protein
LALLAFGHKAIQLRVGGLKFVLLPTSGGDRARGFGNHHSPTLSRQLSQDRDGPTREAGFRESPLENVNTVGGLAELLDQSFYRGPEGRGACTVSGTHSFVLSFFVRLSWFSNLLNVSNLYHLTGDLSTAFFRLFHGPNVKRDVS